MPFGNIRRTVGAQRRVVGLPRLPRRGSLGDISADAVTAIADKYGGLIKLAGTLGMGIKWMRDWRARRRAARTGKG